MENVNVNSEALVVHFPAGDAPVAIQASVSFYARLTPDLGRVLEREPVGIALVVRDFAEETRTRLSLDRDTAGRLADALKTAIEAFDAAARPPADPTSAIV